MTPMSPVTLLAALLGAGTGVGLLLILRGILGPSTEQGPSFAQPRRTFVARLLVSRRPGDGRRLAVAVAVGLLVGVVTRWPVAGVLAAAAGWVLPGLIGPDRDHKHRLARIEAVATWTESLRDTLGAAAGLEQAITATAAMAPTPIREEVTRLAARLRRGDRLAGALRVFAVELDDATGDLVVTALVMAAERNARHIGDLLTSLASAARDQASLRMRVMAGRARIRTSSRVITAVTLSMAAGLVLFNHHYLIPYDGASGQLVLVVVGALFAFGFAWLSRISRIDQPERVLASAEPRHGATPEVVS
jgi:Flp pilus assembly protein TadB